MSDDINKETVAELRKIRRTLLALLVLLVIGFLPSFYAGLTRGASEATPTWPRVTRAVERQDFATALSMARALVDRQPNYYYGHAYLAGIYLATGDVTNAERHYLRSFQLFPTEDAEKQLAAARKRLAEPERARLLSNEATSP